jgi:hypothetical protein
VNPFKIVLLLLFVLAVCLFLRATVLRVEVQAGSSPDAGVISMLAVGFLVLFLSGICYGLWALFLQHYIVFTLTREWITGILSEVAKPGEEEREGRYTVYQRESKAF